MASPVDISNMALSHLGSRAQVSSIDPPDGSVEAGYCARFYAICRKEAHESFKPNWAKRRAILAEQAINLSDIWRYAYELPSDCITALRVLQFMSVADYAVPVYTDRPIIIDDITLFTERGSSDYEIEGDTLYTNQQSAVLLYEIDEVDTTKWSATFTTFVSYLLASYLAGPILKGQDGASASAQLRKIAAQIRGEAAVHSANQSAERADHFPDQLRRR